MKTTIIALTLLIATAAHAQYNNGYTVHESYPSNGNPATQPGSYANPYVIQNQRGQQVGTMTYSYPSTSPQSQPGSYSNPYQVRPNPYYNQR